MKDPISVRRELHQYAERSWHEIRTSARIAEELAEIGYTPIMGEQACKADIIPEALRPDPAEIALSMKTAVEQGAAPVWVDKTGGIPGVVAVLDSGKPGPVTAFRADIDALPYSENPLSGGMPASCGFASVNPAVHACGHDGHSAIVLGLARKVWENRDKIKGKVKFLFQPAEEAFFGAQSMVAAGHLDDVDEFVSMHIALNAENMLLPADSIATGCDDFLSYRRWDVAFTGNAAHPCGAAQEGRNAILAACAAVIGIHSIAPHEEGLMRVNVGIIQGGSAVNTIADSCTICLEFRGETEDISTYAEGRIRQAVEGAAAMYGCTFSKVDYGDTESAKSDRTLMEKLAATARRLGLFKGGIYELGQVGGSDDATVMMRQVQRRGGFATYMGIGAGITATLHSPSFDFDESCILSAIDLFAGLLGI